MSPRIPARLHVLLAARATTAVVLRRGPSKQVASFLWDRNGDRFELGQWLHGRIYERRCDISPDGKHLIYFAMNGRWRSEVRGSWTAISRAPYLKAISLYAKGDCWEGGGLFLSNDRFWLNDRCFQPGCVQFESPRLRRDPGYWPEQRYNAEDTGVYYVRLQRDGWKLIEHRQGNKLDAVAIFEKPMPNGWTLRKIAHEQIGAPPGKGCYWDEHVLIDAKRNETVHADWEWADVDGTRIVWCANGSLHAAACTKGSPLGDATLLHDFDPYSFASIEAPY
jgi:hypothetical protein